MLILSFIILAVTLEVRLKIESLSGLTDLVVSMTKTRGGLRTFPNPLPWPSPCPPEDGQFWHLQPTHRRSAGQRESGVGDSGSQSQPGGSWDWHLHSCNKHCAKAEKRLMEHASISFCFIESWKPANFFYSDYIFVFYIIQLWYQMITVIGYKCLSTSVNSSATLDSKCLFGRLIIIYKQ